MTELDRETKICSDCKISFKDSEIVGLNGKDYCIKCFDNAIKDIGNKIRNIWENIRKAIK